MTTSELESLRTEMEVVIAPDPKGIIGQWMVRAIAEVERLEAREAALAEALAGALFAAGVGLPFLRAHGPAGSLAQATTRIKSASAALDADAGEVVGRCSKCGSTPLSRHYGRPIPGEMRCNLCAEHCASSAEHVRCSCGDPRCNYDGHHGNTHHLAAGAGEGTTQEDTT